MKRCQIMSSSYNLERWDSRTEWPLAGGRLPDPLLRAGAGPTAWPHPFPAGRDHVCPVGRICDRLRRPAHTR
jgi:hypothetical protein